MYKSGNTSLIRNLNKQHVLNLVRMNPGISARDISEETKLQMSTVLYTLRSLKDDGLVVDVGYGNTTLQGGKPPVKWDLSKEFGFVVGIELLSREARLVLMNFSGEIIRKQRRNITPSQDVDYIVRQTNMIVNELLESTGISKSRVLGIGFGIPGSIDHESGNVLYSFTFDFHNIEFQKLFCRESRLNVMIDNDANAGALGIKWFTEVGYRLHHLLYVSINQNFSGMGVGFILNQEIYRGAHGAAGEITSFLPDALWSRILKNAKVKYGNCIICNGSNESVKSNIAEIINYAKNGDKGSIFVLREVAKEISKRLVLLVDLFDPEVIIIGGDMCDAEDFIRPMIQERINANVISEITKHTPVQFSPFGIYSGAVGATALILQKYFHTY